MNKILVIMAILLLPATSCFAATLSGSTSAGLSSTATGRSMYGGTTSSLDTTKDTLIGKTSTGVSVAWVCNNAAYSLMTQHISGTKAYGTSYDSTAIYQTVNNVKPGDMSTNTLNSKSDSTAFSNASNWTAM